MSNKLREALSKAGIALSWATHGHLTESDAEKYLAIVDAALAEPLKNYEAGTPEEQAKRFDVYCHTGGHLCSSVESCAECTIAWEHAPYEKGESNEQ